MKKNHYWRLLSKDAQINRDIVHILPVLTIVTDDERYREDTVSLYIGWLIFSVLIKWRKTNGVRLVRKGKGIKVFEMQQDNSEV